MTRTTATGLVVAENSLIVYDAVATGYYPTADGHSTPENRLEGGPVDKRGYPLCTLGQFLRKQAPFVSIAMWKNRGGMLFCQYGSMFRSPELEIKYRRRITLLAVDVGRAITEGRVDICCDDKRQAETEIGAGLRLTLIGYVLPLTR